MGKRSPGLQHQTKFSLRGKLPCGQMAGCSPIVPPGWAFSCTGLSLALSCVRAGMTHSAKWQCSPAASNGIPDLNCPFCPFLGHVCSVTYVSIVPILQRGRKRNIGRGMVTQGLSGRAEGRARASGFPVLPSLLQ